MKSHTQKLQYFLLVFGVGGIHVIFKRKDLHGIRLAKLGLKSIFSYHIKATVKLNYSFPLSSLIFWFLFDLLNSSNSGNTIYNQGIIYRVVVEMLHTKCCFNEL